MREIPHLGALWSRVALWALDALFALTVVCVALGVVVAILGHQITHLVLV